MFLKLKKLWQTHPLLVIIIIAVIPRIIAAIFSKGYGMHDDHFGPIELPFMVIKDISVWEHRGHTYGPSMVYPTIHYVIFNLIKLTGIDDPQQKMTIIRFLHAIYSLLIVIFGYKIVEVLSNKEIARKAGLILALLWLMPFMSVRNLVEIVCIPPMMVAFYLIAKYLAYKEYNKTHQSKDESIDMGEISPKNKNHFRLTTIDYRLTAKFNWEWLVAGLMFGIAFSFRYQTLLITGTTGLILIFRKEFKYTFLFALGFLISAFLIQGTLDWYMWGYPFAAFREYLLYNSTHGEDYTTGPWYNFILLIFGVLIPPISLLLIYGYLRTLKKYLLLFLPALVFFVFHSYFPNKQERFILPIVPIIIVLGVLGWETFVEQSKFWLNHKRLLKGFWVWFWVVNSILLLMFSFTYSKKTRVESLYYLSKKNDVQGVFIMGGKLGTVKPPLFYLNKYPIPAIEIQEHDTLEVIKNRLINSNIKLPNYAIFFGVEDLKKRAADFEHCFNKKLNYQTTIEPSLADNIFYHMNPKYNVNQTAFIYKLNNK